MRRGAGHEKERRRRMGERGEMERGTKLGRRGRGWAMMLLVPPTPPDREREM